MASSNVFRTVVLEPGVHKLNDLDCCRAKLSRFGREWHLEPGGEGFRFIGRSTLDLQGMRVTELSWTQPQSDEPVQGFPWSVSLRDGSTQTGVRLGLKDEAQTQRLCAP